jgi:Flp pilus assembly protein protease CpaA
MVPASFHDFFNGCASVAGALIGLLFVALSVGQEKLTGADARTEHQVRAAAAFSALVNTLVIALVGLLPLASLSEAGIILAAAGLATTIGLVVVLYREHQGRVGPGDVRMLALLVILYGLQLANSVALDGAPRDVGGISRQGGLAILFFLFGIARSWQLVGARNVSLASTVTAVIQRPGSQDRAGGAATVDDADRTGGGSHPCSH